MRNIFLGHWAPNLARDVNGTSKTRKKIQKETTKYSTLTNTKAATKMRNSNIQEANGKKQTR